MRKSPALLVYGTIKELQISHIAASEVKKIFRLSHQIPRVEMQAGAFCVPRVGHIVIHYTCLWREAWTSPLIMTGPYIYSIKPTQFHVCICVIMITITIITINCSTRFRRQHGAEKLKKNSSRFINLQSGVKLRQRVRTPR